MLEEEWMALAPAEELAQVERLEEEAPVPRVEAAQKVAERWQTDSGLT